MTDLESRMVEVTPPELDVSSVSSGGSPGNASHDSDNEDDDSFISCTLHSTTSQQLDEDKDDNDIPWSDIPLSDKPLDTDATTNQLVVVVYDSPLDETKQSEPQSQIRLPGQRRKRQDLIQSACFDSVLASSSEKLVCAGCYPCDSAFDDRIMCNLCELWRRDEVCQVPQEQDLVTVAVEVG
jgi:hypothetical protein